MIMEADRYIYHTQGVCSPEIHFNIKDNKLYDLRFVGGGCPGNAQMISRLMEGMPIDQAQAQLSGIICRNNTSCPDQLGRALAAISRGDLSPATSFQLFEDTRPMQRVGLIGSLEGNDDILEAIIEAAKDYRLDAVYALGGLSCHGPIQPEMLKRIKKEGVRAISGQMDYQYARHNEPPDMPPIPDADRDRLLQIPQVTAFTLGERTTVGFYGKYITELEGFSDFEPYALEMNMVCNLANLLEDESVFPALEALTPQFKARIVLFGQRKIWGQWKIGDVDFISVGAALEDGLLQWGILKVCPEGLDLIIQEMNWH